MGRADYFKWGDYNAICQKCGFKYKASALKLQWNGFRVCKTCWNPRQPQDFVRGVPDTQTPPWSLPDQAQTFVPSCTPQGISAISGTAVPGCCIPHYISPAYFNPANQIDGTLPNNPIAPGCTLATQSAIPGFGGPGCMIPSKTTGYPVINPDEGDN